MPTYKLTYFNGKGRAEVARLLFAKAGVPYEDNRITGENWPKLKESTPFGSLPLLEVDGVPIAQSYAIVSFLGKRFGLHGKTDIDEAHINSICHAIIDISNVIVTAMMEKDEEKKAALKKTLQEEKLPNLLKFLNKILEKNGTGYFVGKEMTVADIFFAHSIDAPKIVGVEVDFASCPKLKELKAKVENDPKIAAWIKKRPETPF